MLGLRKKDDKIGFGYDTSIPSLALFKIPTTLANRHILFNLCLERCACLDTMRVLHCGNALENDDTDVLGSIIK